MKKETKKGLIIIGSIILFIAVALVLLYVFAPRQPYVLEDSRIYTSFDDFEFLDEYVIAENQYKDKHIKKYNVSEAKNITIKYDGVSAYLVAYIFDNDKDCRDYASDVSGNDYDYKTKNKHIYNTSSLWYSHKTTIWFKTTHKGKYLAFYGNKLYYVKSSASSKNFRKLVEFINFELPQQFEIKTVEEKI
ncbi:MAG: hypothetical protein IJ358_03000 [Clostridia bacterium]|nr:hypothetical protein [Clostridia bacterium]